jgi:death-on-curing protein
MSEPIWIPKEVALALHLRQLAEHGGSDGIRDDGLLESALARAQQLYSYGDPLPDLCALAASYAHGIAKNHPFVDGNKRTAYVVMRLFLLRNGMDLTATKENRYETMLALAAGEHGEESFATWLRENSGELDA